MDDQTDDRYRRIRRHNRRSGSLAPVLGCALALLLVGGCSAAGDDAPSGPTRSEDAVAAPQVAPPVTGSRPVGADEVRVSALSGAEPAMKYWFESVTEMAKSDQLVAVVLGRVETAEDIWIDAGWAFRLLTVRVEERLFGHAEETIVVLEEGGFVPWDVFAKWWDPKDGKLPDSPPKLAEQPCLFGANHTMPNDEVVLFLGETSAESAIGGAKYFALSAGFGQYTVNTDSGEFERAAGVDRKSQPGVTDWVLTLEQLRAITAER